MTLVVLNSLLLLINTSEADDPPEEFDPFEIRYGNDDCEADESNNEYVMQWYLYTYIQSR